MKSTALTLTVVCPAGVLPGRELRLGTVGEALLCSSPTALSFLSALHQTP